MHVFQVHPVTSENQFHCTRLSGRLVDLDGTMQTTTFMTFFWTFQKPLIAFTKALFSIIANAGAKQSILDWFQRSLSGRTICTRALDALSPAGTVTSEVPQGSVLGPLLFLKTFMPQLMLSQPALLTTQYCTRRIAREAKTPHAVLFRLICPPFQGGPTTITFSTMAASQPSCSLVQDQGLQLNSPRYVTQNLIFCVSGHTHLGVTLASNLCCDDHINRLGGKVAAWLRSPVQKSCFFSHAWNDHSSLLCRIYSTTHRVLQCSVVHHMP